MHSPKPSNRQVDILSLSPHFAEGKVIRSSSIMKNKGLDIADDVSGVSVSYPPSIVAEQGMSAT